MPKVVTNMALIGMGVVSQSLSRVYVHGCLPKFPEYHQNVIMSVSGEVEDRPACRVKKGKY